MWEPESQAGAGNTVTALLAGTSWVAGGADAGPTVISFSFVNGSSTFCAAYGASGFQDTLQEFRPQDKQQVREALASIEAVCNVRFLEVEDNASGSGTLRYGFSQKPNEMGFSGYAFFPSDMPQGGDIWISGNQQGAEWDGYRPYLLLHETLHALGLKHPDSGAGAAESPVQAIPDTVMSTSAIAGLALGGLSRYPAEPMPLDLLALQALYGSVAGNSGDTVYDLSAPRWNDGFRVIWDSDGVDVLDASGCTDGVTLDLRQGARSGLGTEVFAFAQVQTGPRPETVSDTYAQTLTVARGSAIENAVGSDFDDVLTGNELANRLTGGGGSDRIDGGDGSDTAVYEGPRSRYAVDVDGVGRLLVRDKLDGATDTLSSIEWLAFSDGPAVRAAEAIGLASSSLPALHTAEAFRLYQAAFDRLPDMAGLVYQTQALDSGLALAGLAGNFIQSNEFNRNYGALDDLQFVTRLYLNVLHRQPDEGGLAFHAARLAAGNSRADLLVSFSESAEHQAALVGVIQDSLGLS